MTDEVSVSLGEQPFSATEVTRAVTTDPRVPHSGTECLVLWVTLLLTADVLAIGQGGDLTSFISL